MGVEGDVVGRGWKVAAAVSGSVAVLLAVAVLVWGLPWSEETGDRVVSGSSAPVGDGRLTRLTSGPVTVIVPPESVTVAGDVRIGSSGTAVPEPFEAAGPIVDVSLDGTQLAGPITMEVAVEGGSDAIVQLTQDTGTGEWQVDEGSFDPATGRLISTVTHLSPKAVVRLPTALLKGIADVVVGEKLISQFGDVEAPTCSPQDFPPSQGWQVTSGSDPRTKWCLTRTEPDGRSITIRNGRRYGVSVDVPASLPASRPALDFELASLIKWIGEQGDAQGRQLVVLERGADAVVDLSSIPVGQDESISVSFDGFGWMADIVDLSVTLLTAIFARVPSWAVAGQIKRFENRKEFLDNVELYRCLSGRLSADVLRSTDPAVLTELFGGVSGCMIDLVKAAGPAAWLLSPLSTLVSIAGGLLVTGGSAATAVVDLVRGDAYRIDVQRRQADPCATVVADLGDGSGPVTVVDGLCDGSWALVDLCTDCGGDTWVVAERTDSKWTTRFTFPSDVCEADARAAGVSTAILDRVNWPPCDAPVEPPAGTPATPAGDCDPVEEAERLRGEFTAAFDGYDSWTDAPNFDAVARSEMSALTGRCGSDGAFAVVEQLNVVGRTYQALTSYISS